MGRAEVLLQKRKTDLLRINSQSYSYQHLKVEIAPVDIPMWLKAQTLFPKVCWMQKGTSLQRAAVGNLLSFSSVPLLSFDSHPEVRLYGGVSGTTDPSWSSFPPCAFWLPQFEIIQEEGRAVLHIHFIDEEANPIAMRQLRFEEKKSCWSGAILERRQDFPSFPQWENSVATALEKMDRGLLEKIVLARKTRIQADRTLDPYTLLSEIQTPNATVFSFQLAEEAAFIGATPEKLYYRQGHQIQTDAIAGTRPRGQSQDEDWMLGQELLESPKEQREFALVKQFIQTALEPRCDAMQWNEEESLVQTPHVQHIGNQLVATLKSGISDRDLIETLHPTPALGGTPRHVALNLLSQLEPFQRGWYGAPVGYISAQEADIAVAIRSALVRNKQIDLFAGTGIVKGSHPEKEWDELEQKIAMFAGVFT